MGIKQRLGIALALLAQLKFLIFTLMTLGYSILAILYCGKKSLSVYTKMAELMYSAEADEMRVYLFQGKNL